MPIDQKTNPDQSQNNDFLGIYQAIPKIMADLKAVGKDQKNTYDNYKFRGIDDVYNGCQKIMAKHGVFTAGEIIKIESAERVSNQNKALFYKTIHMKWRFYATDGSYIEHETITEAMDRSDKAFNKAMAVAHKYAILQVFCIPTEEAKDPENDSHEVQAKSNKEGWQGTEEQLNTINKYCIDMGFDPDYLDSVWSEMIEKMKGKTRNEIASIILEYKKSGEKGNE